MIAWFTGKEADFGFKMYFSDEKMNSNFKYGLDENYTGTANYGTKLRLYMI